MILQVDIKDLKYLYLCSKGIKTEISWKCSYDRWQFHWRNIKCSILYSSFAVPSDVGSDANSSRFSLLYWCHAESDTVEEFHKNVLSCFALLLLCQQRTTHLFGSLWFSPLQWTRHLLVIWESCQIQKIWQQRLLVGRLGLRLPPDVLLVDSDVQPYLWQPECSAAQTETGAGERGQRERDRSLLLLSWLSFSLVTKITTYGMLLHT